MIFDFPVKMRVEPMLRDIVKLYEAIEPNHCTVSIDQRHGFNGHKEWWVITAHTSTGYGRSHKSESDAFEAALLNLVFTLRALARQLLSVQATREKTLHDVLSETEQWTMMSVHDAPNKT